MSKQSFRNHEGGERIVASRIDENPEKNKATGGVELTKKRKNAVNCHRPKNQDESTRSVSAIGHRHKTVDVQYLMDDAKPMLNYREVLVLAIENQRKRDEDSACRKSQFLAELPATTRRLGTPRNALHVSIPNGTVGMKPATCDTVDERLVSSDQLEPTQS